MIKKKKLPGVDFISGKRFLTEMKESFIGKNKDSRSDDVCLVPLLYFRHQFTVKIITGKEDIRCSGTYN